MILSGRLMEYARQCVRDGVFDVLQEIVLAEFAKEIATLEARIEELEEAYPEWDAGGYCLACNRWDSEGHNKFCPRAALRSEEER